MKSIDKNDVDVTKLFRWGSKFEVLDSRGSVLTEAYIRLVGDAELNRARVFALRKSAEMRRKLNDEYSDERIAYIPDVTTLDKDNVVETLLIYKVRDFTTEAMKDYRPKLPKEPDSDATLQDQEEYQEVVDSYPQMVDKDIKERVEALLNAERERLRTLDIETLTKEFEKQIINQVCEDEMLQKFREMCVYFGSYSDNEFQNKMFKTFDDFDNIPTQLKVQFLEFYNTLEISGEDLKKLPEVMQ